MEVVTTPLGKEIHVEGDSIRWSGFQALLVDDAEARASLTRHLRDDPKPAFYFECTPWFEGSDPVFRFVLVPAPGLASRPVDRSTFSTHFRVGTGACRTFANLRGDSTLVVPVPEGADEGFGHLASWLRSASESQIDEVWRAMGVAIADWRSSSRPLWLSTSGGGVAWVHMRLDPRPKYYKHAAYRSLMPTE